MSESFLSLKSLDSSLMIILILTVCARASDSNWNSHCDISEPYGFIDIFDIVMVVGSYGKEWSGVY